MRLPLAGLAFVLAAAPLPAHAWNGPSHERVVVYALRLIPPALRNQLLRNQEELLDGVREPDQMTPAESHSLNVDGSVETLAPAMDRAIGDAIRHVQEQGSFADLARAYGRISHYAADAAFPLNSSDSEPREAQFFADYEAYAGSKLSKYPAIFDGYAPLASPDFSPALYLRSVAERANQSYPLVTRAYFPDGGARRSSRTFDDRGPVFGVTQLAFIRAVSATANLWLYAWREAHGDLAGTPHYPAVARSTTSAKNLSRPAQRP